MNRSLVKMVRFLIIILMFGTAPITIAQADHSKKPTNKAKKMNQVVLPAKRSGHLLLAAVGDILMHNTLQRDAANQATGFDNQFSRISAVLKHADITFANLEVPTAANVVASGRLVKGPAGRYDNRVYTGYPNFNAHPSLVSSIKSAGIDVVQTANNHSLDRQWRGIDATIDTLRAAKLPFTGTRHTQDKTAPWYTITRANARGRSYNIAWLACTYGTNDIPDRHKQVLFCFKQQAEVLATITALSKRRDIHAIMFMPHWGREYRHAPTDRQKKLAKLALDAGATAVVGTHPHVLQPIERYKTKDGRNGFIAYSLGNFISGQPSLARRSSIVLFMDMAPAKGGRLTVKKFRFLPVHTLRTTNGYFVQPAGADKRSKATIDHILKILPEAAMLGLK